jgi:sugar (pentulose or hexulose) kinase
MFLGFDIGASSVKAVLLDGGNRVAAVAGADLPGQMRAASLDAVCKRAWRIGTFRADAARAATFAASRARWRRLAPFAEEISQ